MVQRAIAGGLAIFLVLPAIPAAAQPAPVTAAIEVASKNAGDRSAVWLRFGETSPLGFYTHGKLWASLQVDGEQATGELLHDPLSGKPRRYELRYHFGEKKLAIDGKTLETGAVEAGESDTKTLWFIVTSFGRVASTQRFLAPPSDEDLDSAKKFSLAWHLDRDLEQAETYRYNFELDDQKGWVVAWDEQHPISHSDGARVARLRLFADGRVVGARSPHEALVRRKISERAATELAADLVAMAGDPEIVSDKQASVAPLSGSLWNQEQEFVRIVRDGKAYAIHVTHPSAEGDLGSIPLGWKEMNERLWALLHEPMASVSEARAAIEAKLDEKIDVAIGPVGLIFALDALERQGGVKVTVDLARLKEKGVTHNHKIEYSSRGKPLRESFKEVLASAGLDFEVTDDGVFIPAREPAGK